jgi:hypothetical protein
MTPTHEIRRRSADSALGAPSVRVSTHADFWEALIMRAALDQSEGAAAWAYDLHEINKPKLALAA